MQLIPRYRSPLLLIIGFTLLATTVLGSLWLVDQQEHAVQAVRHTLEVQKRLGTILSRLQDAEAAQRGYLLNGKAQYLAPYQVAVSGLRVEFAALGVATADNQAQTARVRTLTALSDQQQDVLRTTIERYRRDSINMPDASAHQGDGGLVMDRLRRVVAEMNDEERRLLENRYNAATRQASLVKLGLVASALATILLALIAVKETRQRLYDALTARDALSEANELLIAEITDREAAEGQVRQMQKVESIGQLTGGIAHDFNNMLAIVIGSLDLAQRRFDDAPSKAKAYIDNAVDGARRAAQLTARLLAFSRQQALEPHAIDTNKRLCCIMT